MTNEASLNTILANSFSELTECRAHKIADPKGGLGIQNPFDHFGVFNGKPLYSESKILKKIEAFNFNKIEEHQYENLNFYQNALRGNCYTLVFLGIYIPRKMKVIIPFDFGFIYHTRLSGKKSFLKKELEFFLEKGLFLPINYQTFINGEGKVVRKELIPSSSLSQLDQLLVRGL